MSALVETVQSSPVHYAVPEMAWNGAQFTHWPLGSAIGRVVVVVVVVAPTYTTYFTSLHLLRHLITN